jgi:hypothetical protein
MWPEWSDRTEVWQKLECARQPLLDRYETGLDTIDN